MHIQVWDELICIVLTRLHLFSLTVENFVFFLPFPDLWQPCKWRTLTNKFVSCRVFGN